MSFPVGQTELPASSRLEPPFSFPLKELQSPSPVPRMSYKVLQWALLLLSKGKVKAIGSPSAWGQNECPACCLGSMASRMSGSVSLDNSVCNSEPGSPHSICDRTSLSLHHHLCKGEGRKEPPSRELTDVVTPYCGPLSTVIW